MGYKVIYPQLGKGHYRIDRRLPKKMIISASCAIFVGAIIVWIIGRFGLSWLLPGDPVVTENALQAMVDRLRAGEGLGDAVTTFCREVVAGAG